MEENNKKIIHEAEKTLTSILEEPLFCRVRSAVLGKLPINYICQMVPEEHELVTLLLRLKEQLNEN